MSEELRKYRVPAFCPVCERLMRGDKSNHSYYNFGCCNDCLIQWVEGREERWRSGWRPSKEQLDKWLVIFEKMYP